MDQESRASERWKPRVYITMGDPAGIGAEIIVRTLSKDEIYALCTPILIGSFPVVKDVLHFLPSQLSIHRIEHPNQAIGELGTIDLIDLGNIRLSDFEYGKPQSASGKAASEYMITARSIAQDQLNQEHLPAAIVNGPVNTAALWMAGYSGKNEIEPFLSGSTLQFHIPMVLQGDLRIAHVTGTMDLHRIFEELSTEKILTTISQAAFIAEQLGVQDPRIGVCSLNPYAGENGILGREEEEKIIPALRLAKAKGFRVEGPITPDMIVPYLKAGRFDLGIAMYHDQGFTALRSRIEYQRRSNRWQGFHGCCLYLGLPFILASVLHGTAYDRAGEGKASEDSMIEAVRTAATLARANFTSYHNGNNVPTSVRDIKYRNGGRHETGN
ncbi:MAG: 4-hydroxythreonine-4-phosphate dehydrogenase PdxA [Spirochaetes bacterium]|nr:4-hydroxythreonine-4-phosphate dehydrogenase PdxA [Spirochaetota bacterium]